MCNRSIKKPARGNKQEIKIVSQVDSLHGIG